MTSPFVSSIYLWDFKLWENMRDSIAPLSFWLELTSRCNNNCRHCYGNLPSVDSAVKEKEITLEEIEQIADEAASMGCLGVLMTGGEPMIREDFFDIYRYLKKKGLLITIFTNGTQITEEHIALFKSSPPWKIDHRLRSDQRDL
jgi:MoaA/NifB/PqqE/SkfB family radical SAM enzyme